MNLNKNLKNIMKQIVKNVLFLLLLAGFIGFPSCTKTSGCEFVEGDFYLTGTFHYYKVPVKMHKWPGEANAVILDVNAFLVKDNSEGSFFDTIVITKSSVPNEYRKEGERHVAISIESTLHGAATTTEGRHDFYKLLCIEEIE